jgi:hypothetical protein
VLAINVATYNVFYTSAAEIHRTGVRAVKVKWLRAMYGLAVSVE